MPMLAGACVQQYIRHKSQAHTVASASSVTGQVFRSGVEISLVVAVAHWGRFQLQGTADPCLNLASFTVDLRAVRTHASFIITVIMSRMMMIN